MRKVSIAVAIATCVVFWNGARYEEEDDVRELRRINAVFIHNYVTNNVASHDTLIHTQFVHISSTGKWVGRKEYLENWKTGFDPEKIVYWDYRSERITVIGTTALVRSVNKYTVVENERKVTGMSQYTDTYVKENGRWKCIQAQITNVAPEHFPGDETIVKKYINGRLQ